MDNTDELIIYHIFNGERPIADSLLNTQINQFPDNPKYYLLKCQNYFYSRYFNPGEFGGDSLLFLMNQSAIKAIEIAEKNDMTLTNKFYLGAAYGYLARFLGREGSYWEAYLASRKAREYLFEVLDERPSFVDAKQELAIQEYFIGTRGIWIQFLAWLADMGSNRTEALQQFHEIAEKGSLCKTEAQFVSFALYHFIENDHEQARIIGTKFLESYPNNRFVSNQLARAGFLALVQSRGVDFLETEFDSLGTRYGITNPNILNLLGYNFINQGRTDEAIKVLKINIRLYPDVANGYDSLSEAYELNGNVALAIKNAKICLQKLPADSTLNEDFREVVRESSEARLLNLGAGDDRLNI
jgi:tetratricopeptide (TPR) repeat protein